MRTLVFFVACFLTIAVTTCSETLTQRPKFVTSVCGGTSWTHTLSCMVCHYQQVQPISRCCMDRLSAAVCRRHIGHFAGRPAEGQGALPLMPAQGEAWEARSKMEDPGRVHSRRYPSIFLKTSWGPGVKRNFGTYRFSHPGLWVRPEGKRAGGPYRFFQPALWVKSSSWPPGGQTKRWNSLTLRDASNGRGRN